MFNKNLNLEVFKNSRFQGRRNMGARGSRALDISEEWARPPNISEDGAKHGLEFATIVEIHPLSFYLTN